MKQKTQSDVALRRATIEDIERLCDICRDSFPASLLWHNRLHAREWWMNMVTSADCEVWLAEIDNVIVGFTAIIVDENRWKEEAASRTMPAAARIATAIRHPSVVLRVVINKLRREERPLEIAPEFWLEESARLFNEIIAVSPAARGRNVGRILVRLGLERAQERGLRGIHRRAERWNKRIISLFLAEGYRAIGADGRGYLFCKHVSDD